MTAKAQQKGKGTIARRPRVTLRLVYYARASDSFCFNFNYYKYEFPTLFEINNKKKNQG